ncbi:MAG: hypothetical protein DMG89_00315 [Acidobacteria bacterium]|nr:MAG: hypothetical protein DMG89_00315 [Acidobacteriota bacterium]
MIGYVVMPEHVHLLMGDRERGNPSTVMQALKQGFARQLLRLSRMWSDPRGTAVCGTWSYRCQARIIAISTHSKQIT